MMAGHQQFRAAGDQTVDVIALSLGNDVDDETVLRTFGLAPPLAGGAAGDSKPLPNLQRHRSEIMAGHGVSPAVESRSAKKPGHKEKKKKKTGASSRSKSGSASGQAPATANAATASPAPSHRTPLAIVTPEHPLKGAAPIIMYPPEPERHHGADLLSSASSSSSSALLATGNPVGLPSLPCYGSPSSKRSRSLSSSTSMTPALAGGGAAGGAGGGGAGASGGGAGDIGFVNVGLPRLENLIFVDPIPQILICPACRRLCKDPVIASRCGHTVCRACVIAPQEGRALVACPIDDEPIMAEAVFPNLALKQQIDEMLVYCPNGIVEGSLDASLCQEKIPTRSLLQHLEECPYSLVMCTFCQKSGPLRRKDFQLHLQTCQSLPCLHAQLGCQYIGTRGSLDHHLQAECRYEPIKDFAAMVLRSIGELKKENAELRQIVQTLYARLDSPDVRSLKAIQSITTSSSSITRANTSPTSAFPPRRESLPPPIGTSSRVASSTSVVTTTPTSPPKLPFAITVLPTLQVVWKCSIVGHTDTVWSLSVGPGILVSSSSDLSVRVWDTTTPEYQCKYHLVGHRAIVYASTLGERTIYSGDATGMIRVWGLYSQGSLLHEIQAHSNSVCKLVISSEYGLLFSGSLYEVKVWGLRNFNCLRTLSGHRHWVRGMAIAGKHLVTGSGGAGNAISVWDLSTLAIVKQFSPAKGSPSIYSLVVNGKYIFSATYANTVDIWDMESGTCVDKLIGHSAAVYGLCLLSDHRLASCSYDGTIRIWDLRSNRCIQNLIRQKTSLECIVADPDGLHFFSGASEGTISAYGPAPDVPLTMTSE